MRRSPIALALPAAAMLALAACGAGDEAPEEDPMSAEAGMDAEPTEAEESESPSPEEPALPEAADGTDYDECFDGTCTVLVTEGVEVEFDEGEFRVGTVSVESIADESVQVDAVGGGGHLSFTLTVGPTGNFQGTLIVEVLGIDGDEAVLEFYPA